MVSENDRLPNLVSYHRHLPQMRAISTISWQSEGEVLGKYRGDRASPATHPGRAPWFRYEVIGCHAGGATDASP